MSLEEHQNYQGVIISSSGPAIAGESFELILSVLAEFKSDYSFHYFLANQPPASQLGELVEAYELASHVTSLGQLSDAELEQLLAATDIALCLPEQATPKDLHHLSRLMAAGVPTLVFNSDAFMQLPDESVVKIDRDEYAAPMLRAFLERLMEDERLRARIGANARLYAESNGEQAVSRRVETNTGPPLESSSQPAGRFQKLAGIDYKRGAILYPDRLDQNNRHHLLTKPFYNLAHKIARWDNEGMDEETHRHFCDFANMAVALALPAGARLLDVGCGSGWLSEYFARLGYDVTGIDISPELIAMADERLRRVPYGVDLETPLRYRFLVQDIEAAPLDELFDAIICYDALHHFEDEHAVLAHLSGMLKSGGLLFVLEGERPPAGSETEEELRSVMRQYETLESPFDAGYLRALLKDHGFAIVGDYLSVNGLFERERLNEQKQLSVEPAAVNYLLCKKVSTGGRAVELPDSRQPGLLRASFTLLESWTNQVTPGAQLQLSFEVSNTGDTLWLVSRAALKGTVRLGLKILDAAGKTIEEVHGVPPLPQALAPGERARLRLNHQAPLAPGAYTLKLDLVDSEVCWFEQQGSEPLLLPFEVK
ncbi:MAG TPA: methyltransferase domain-containing protein [Pyrinomonadaceae bacterium]|jgi:SAM-dependent methyltransferase